MEKNLHKIYVANVTTTRKNITTIYDIGGLLNAITTYTQSVQTKQAYNTFTQRIFTNELQVDVLKYHKYKIRAISDMFV